MNDKEINNIENVIKSYMNMNSVKINNVLPYVIKVKQIEFKDFRRNFQKPYDSLYSSVMLETMKELCKRVPQCTFGYNTLNEINLFCYYTSGHKYLSIKGSLTVQSICSIVSSNVTSIFNEKFINKIKEIENKDIPECQKVDTKIYRSKLNKAIFEVDAFNLPKEEMYNYILYKYINSRRNALVNASLSYMREEERFGKKSSEVIQILKEKYDYNLNSKNVSCRFKNGVFVNYVKINNENAVQVIEIVNDLKEKGKCKDKIERMLFSTNYTIDGTYQV